MNGGISIQVLEHLGFCRLQGKPGSNPELVVEYPKGLLGDFEKREVIQNALPFGSDPNSTSIKKMEKKILLSWIFSISHSKGDLRADLASFFIIVVRRAFIEDYKTLLEFLGKGLLEHAQDLLVPELDSLGSALFDAIRLKQGIEWNGVYIKLPEYISQKNLKIYDLKKKMLGRLFQ